MDCTTSFASLLHDPSSSGGFHESLFINKTDVEAFTCSICRNVKRQTHTIMCQEVHSFCKSCIEQWNHVRKLDFTSCPLCRSPYSVMYPSKDMDRLIQGLQVKCPLECGYSGSLHDLKTVHPAQCPKHIKGVCPHCTQAFYCIELEHHSSICSKRPIACSKCNAVHPADTKHVCPRDIIKCKHCKWTGERRDHSKHSCWQTCPNVDCSHPSYIRGQPHTCTWSCIACEWSGTTQVDYDTHRRTCPEVLVRCPLQDLGCQMVVKRKDLATHLTEAKHAQAASSLKRRADQLDHYIQKHHDVHMELTFALFNDLVPNFSRILVLHDLGAKLCTVSNLQFSHNPWIFRVVDRVCNQSVIIGMFVLSETDQQFSDRCGYIKAILSAVPDPSQLTQVKFQGLSAAEYLVTQWREVGYFYPSYFQIKLKQRIKTLWDLLTLYKHPPCSHMSDLILEFCL